MGEWIVGAFINLFGSIAINFGTNLKLGHDERGKHAGVGSDGANGKQPVKPIMYFQTWRVVYTPEQLAEKYTNVAFLMYLIVLILAVALHHTIYGRGLLLAIAGQDLGPYWHLLLLFSYAVVSGAIGSCSVLFAKSLSNLLRLALSSGYSCTAGLLSPCFFFSLARLDFG